MATAEGRPPVHLDVESLRAFVEVVHLDGFTAAAKALGITQPGVSLKIRRLEERIGLSLIERSGRRWALTEHGRDILAYAKEVVEAHDRAVDHIQRSNLQGAVRLGCTSEVAASGLFEVVTRFGRTHPGAHLGIRVRPSGFVSEMLEVGEIDVAVLQVLDQDGDLRPTDEVWRRDDLHVVQGLAVDFADADPLPLVSYGPRNMYEQYLISALHAAGRSHRDAMVWSSLYGVLRAIEAGLGVGIVNTPNITGLMKPWDGIVPIDLPQVAFVLRTRQDCNELATALAGHLTDTLAPTYT